jgi:hypothetical protein
MFADLAMAREDWEASIHHAESAKLMSASASMHIAAEQRLCDVWLKLGRLDRAESCHVAILRYAPRAAWSHHNYGLFLLHQKRFDDAIRQEQRALAVRDFTMARITLSAAWYGKGLGYLFEPGQAELSKTCFDKAIAADSTNANAWYGLAMYLETRGGPASIDSVSNPLTSGSQTSSVNELDFNGNKVGQFTIGWTLPRGRGQYLFTYNGVADGDYELNATGMQKNYSPPTGQTAQTIDFALPWWRVTIRNGQLRTTKTHARDTAPRMLLPGLLGSGPLWRRACDEVENAYRAGEWVALAGEPGVGKLAILRAVHQRRNPGERFTVLDAADATDRRWLASARRALMDENGDERAGSVVIRHPDQLDGVHLRSLTAALQKPKSVDGKRAIWVAVTLGPGAQSVDLARLLRLFPTTVEVPPLRHHIEDVQQLAPFFVARLGYQGQLTCSPEVLQMLTRSNWPGNIEQVFQTMRQVVRRRRTGIIRPRDLPPETGSLSRRLLSPLESIERDAITQSLLDAHGNKAQAAKALGMSRATIYRKIHEFGIVTPAR